MSEIENYLIKNGFIYPSNEIYGKIQNLWDYGHLGTLLKENLKREWIKFFIFARDKTYLLDCAIFGSEDVWRASGHLDNFEDLLIECKDCNKRTRSDFLQAGCCPFCGSDKLTEPHKFNLMYKVNEYYLRPETAQSIFINFKSIQQTIGNKLPFAVGQIGKAFRNEITIGNSIFRTREFEQMELEQFIFPDQDDQAFDMCKELMDIFLSKKLGIKSESYKFVDIDQSQLAHYSKRNVDIFFNFEHGWNELWGLCSRGNFDLNSHQEAADRPLHYFDHVTNQKIVPYVVEHSLGLNRLLLAVVTDALVKTEDKNGERIVLKIKRELAPYQIAIFPLTNKQAERAQYICNLFREAGIPVFYDVKNSIGKRYRIQDEIGTPFCLTVCEKCMEDPIEECKFTIRERDSMEQRIFNIKDLIDNGFKISWI